MKHPTPAFAQPSAAMQQLVSRCRTQLRQAEAAGLLEKEGHLRRALRALQDAAKTAPPVDRRQGFFAAMLEEPCHPPP